MAKELIYRVKIVPDQTANKKFSQSIERGQERARDATRDTIQEINTEIARLELLEQTGRESVGQLEEQIEKLNATLATSPQQTQKVINAQKRLARLSDRLGDSTQGAARATRGFDKAASGANQTLFSFGDIINDSAQFQFGFAQGSRAIGNNIAYMAEQFSNVSNRAGGFRGALKALGSSLLGPGGIILAVNVAVTALTLFGDKLFSSGKAAKQTKEDLEGLSDTIGSIADELASREFFGDDPFKIKQLQFQQEAITGALQQTQQAQQDIFTIEQERRIARLRGLEDAGALTSELRTELNFLEGLVKEEEKLEKVVEQLKKDQGDISAELEKQRRIQQQVNKLIGQRNQLEQARQIGRADIPATTGEGSFVAGAGAAERIRRQSELAQQLGTTRLAILQSIADKEIQITRNKEKAKTAIQALEERNRIQLTAQAVQTATALINAAFGKNKAAAIASTLIETFASAQAAYRSQLTPPTPDAPARAAAAAALAVAQGLARIATMRKITPENTSAGGGGGGAPSEGFQTGTVQPGANREMLRGMKAPEPVVNVTLRTEADNKVISAKAESGRKRRERDAVRVQSA